MENNREIFKDIKGYEGMYQISNIGRVRSLERYVNRRGDTKRKIKAKIPLCLRINGEGRENIQLHKNGDNKSFQISRLVFQAFKGDLIKGMVIDHIDHNKLNNIAENLQQITQRKNVTKDRWRYNYSSKFMGVSWKKGSKKWVVRIFFDRKSKHLGYFENELQAAEEYQNRLKELKALKIK